MGGGRGGQIGGQIDNEFSMNNEVVGGFLKVAGEHF